MEHESESPKPSDLFIGVLDFFSILLPGVIAVGPDEDLVWLTRYTHRNHGAQSLVTAALKTGAGVKLAENARHLPAGHGLVAGPQCRSHQRTAPLRGRFQAFRSMVVVLTMFLAVRWEWMTKQPRAALVVAIAAVPLSLWLLRPAAEGHSGLLSVFPAIASRQFDKVTVYFKRFCRNSTDAR